MQPKTVSHAEFQIDRSNVGNARLVRLFPKMTRAYYCFRIAGLETDTHLHGNQFNTTLAGGAFVRSAVMGLHLMQN